MKHVPLNIPVQGNLRDQFAGMAMQAWVSKAAFNQKAEDMMVKAGIKPGGEMEAFIAGLAYDMADAMLRERHERTPGLCAITEPLPPPPANPLPKTNVGRML
jgi:hypothetical protein